MGVMTAGQDVALMGQSMTPAMTPASETATGVSILPFGSGSVILQPDAVFNRGGDAGPLTIQMGSFALIPGRFGQAGSVSILQLATGELHVPAGASFIGQIDADGRLWLWPLANNDGTFVAIYFQNATGVYSLVDPARGLVVNGLEEPPTVWADRAQAPSEFLALSDQVAAMPRSLEDRTRPALLDPTERAVHYATIPATLIFQEGDASATDTSSIDAFVAQRGLLSKHPPPHRRHDRPVYQAWHLG